MPAYCWLRRRCRLQRLWGAAWCFGWYSCDVSAWATDCSSVAAVHRLHTHILRPRVLRSQVLGLLCPDGVLIQVGMLMAWQRAHPHNRLAGISCRSDLSTCGPAPCAAARPKDAILEHLLKVLILPSPFKRDLEQGRHTWGRCRDHSSAARRCVLPKESGWQHRRRPRRHAGEPHRTAPRVHTHACIQQAGISGTTL